MGPQLKKWTFAKSWQPTVISSGNFQKKINFDCTLFINPFTLIMNYLRPNLSKLATETDDKGDSLGWFAWISV